MFLFVVGLFPLLPKAFSCRRRRATLDGSAASSAEAAPSARDAALALLVVEGPFLLQLCQLWVVVAALAGSRHLQETKEEEAKGKRGANDKRVLSAVLIFQRRVLGSARPLTAALLPPSRSSLT